jgi:hypothetical protein
VPRTHRGGGRGGDAQGIGEIGRTVGSGAVERALCAGEDDRARVVVHQISEVRGLLHGVGAMGDDDAVHTFLQAAAGRCHQIPQVGRRQGEARDGAEVAGRHGHAGG